MIRRNMHYLVIAMVVFFLCCAVLCWVSNPMQGQIKLPYPQNTNTYDKSQLTKLCYFVNATDVWVLKLRDGSEVIVGPGMSVSKTDIWRTEPNGIIVKQFSSSDSARKYMLGYRDDRWQIAPSACP